MKKRLLDFLAKQPKSWLWMETIILALAVGFLDYATGYEVSVVLFYSLPILLMVWFGDRASSVFVALLCAIIWWWADEASGHPYEQGWHQVWETAVRLGYFLFFVVTGTAVKSRIKLLEHSRQLEQEIIRISEREQRRIGQDLHDGLCQYYAAVGCAAGSLKLNLEKQGSPAAQSAAEIEELILKGVGEARSLARGLSPVENEERGLQFALEDLVHTITKLQSIDCHFICTSPVSVFDNNRANHLFRIAQEAINNATRHGKASVVGVRLSCEHGIVQLTIEDNGCGIPQPLPSSRGMGLNIMQYRARMIDGQLEVAPRPEGGTIVTCSFHQLNPHKPAHDHGILR
ncbi:integral membrane sensor signal transduction histidine kinase [Chthoniobacter flavus Ellin428]|uniref:histidine kinase n=1 Tax=Chthoniobacter flavus Ellin428 TaxID=497964 RepID=B4CY61_9BACT|nr:sensor histidine kinase [Chthoniobacter flavus]EDY21209.1 integral membrane sensor signal transduction histidine kinase [Chthoniobacter flavus Ellin428]TCO87578.1 signal transduction histidine kinase [Chthoniobacter flavus]